MSVREYVGARYVPIVVGEWDKTRTYEPLMVVTYQGNSYTSRQYVPAGIDIANESYWVLSANYNAQVEQYRQEVKSFDGRIAANTNAIETETTNRTAAVTAEMERAQGAERVLQNNIDSIYTHPIFTTAKEMQQAVNLRIGSIVTTLGFNSLNDYGAGTYIITESGTANGMDILQCNGCIATLVIIDNFVRPEQFGYVPSSGNDASPYFRRIMTELKIGNIELNKTYIISHTVFYDYGLSIHMYSPNHKGCLKNGLTNISRTPSDYYVIKDFQTCFSNRTNADSEVSYIDKQRKWADYFILDGIEIDMNARNVNLNKDTIQYGGCSQMFYTFLYKYVCVKNCYIHDSILTPFIIQGVGFSEIKNNHGENISTYYDQYKTGTETENVFELSRVWLDILNVPSANTVHENYLDGFITAEISGNSFNVKDALGNIGSFNMVNISNNYIYNYTGYAHECTCYKAELKSYTFNRNITEIDKYGFNVNVVNCKVLNGTGIIATTEGYADAAVTLTMSNCTAISDSNDTESQIYMPTQISNNTIAKVSNVISINDTNHSFSQNAIGSITYDNCTFKTGEIAYVDLNNSDSEITFSNCKFIKNNPMPNYPFFYLHGWNKVQLVNCVFEDKTTENTFAFIDTTAKKLSVINCDIQAHTSTAGVLIEALSNVILNNTKFSNNTSYAIVINTGSAGVGSKIINLNTIANALINNESFATVSPNTNVITPLF